MTYTPQNLVYVYFHGFNTKKLMGRLLLKNRKYFFEYDSDFIKTSLNLSPFKLPLQSGVIASTDRIFEGLFGVFNDSIADGWGRMLLDRKLMSLGMNLGSISMLDRLFCVGEQGMGALSYKPEHLVSLEKLPTNLDDIDSEIRATLEEDDAYIDDLLILGGSSAGARPKVLLQINNIDWLIKFRSSSDPKDISAIEYAYHLMAKEAGLNVPAAKIFPSRKNFGFFGVERFDRCNDKRIHLHSISGLLHVDHRESSLDYEEIMRATSYLTRDVRQSEVQFRNAVFNVLSHNRDDHAKNFSFLMDINGVWQVSPAYDLTFSSGPAGEHATMVMGEGKNPTKEHLLRLATIGNIKKNNALEIIDQVLVATKKWGSFATIAGVSKLQTKHIGNVLNYIHKKY